MKDKKAGFSFLGGFCRGISLINPSNNSGLITLEGDDTVVDILGLFGRQNGV